MKLSDEIKDRQKTLKEDNLIDRYNELNFILLEIEKLEKQINFIKNHMQCVINDELIEKMEDIK